MTPKFYPAYQTLNLADQIIEAIAENVPGYQGRIGAYWYWRMPGGILVTIKLGYTITAQRWDILHANAVTPNVGQFNAAEFPFRTYATLVSSPPFIHELDGESEWSNRLYFQMGYLIEDVGMWLQMLLAAVIDPQIRPPAAFPDLNPLERELVTYAINELDGYFRLKDLYTHFNERTSRRRLSRLAQSWENQGLLTEAPRRVTLALRSLANDYRLGK